MIKEVDNFISSKLKKRFGESLERRDYYELEVEKDFLKGKGEKSGIMFLVDVNSSHYIDINLYKSGVIRMVFRRDDTSLMRVHCNVKNVESYLDGFLLLIEEYLMTISRFNQISNGEIPTDLVRYNLVNKILED